MLIKKLHMAALVIPMVLMSLHDGFPEMEASLVTPEQALEQLKNGNNRYIAGRRNYPNLDRNRRSFTSTKGQHPFATVIACSDSRVPVEHLFDVGIGDVFVIRVAGNVCDTDEIGSIEYGVDHLKTPLLVVLGHTNCGAVTAVTRGDEVHGNIPPLVDNIIPAVKKAKEKFGNDFTPELLEAAIKNNVWMAVEDLFSRSPETANLVKEKKLSVVGAVYHLDTGNVEWLGNHPDEKGILEKAGADHRHIGPLSVKVLIKIILSTAIVVAAFLAAYLLFFRSREGRKVKVQIRLMMGFVTMIFAVVISSLSTIFISSEIGSKPQLISIAILAASLVLVSLIFGIIFTRSIIKSFRSVISSLKSDGQ